MTTLETPVIVDIQHKPEYFNRVCFCTIPECWIATVVSGIPEIDDRENEEYQERFGYSKFRLYAYGDTREQALQLLGRELRELGYTGRMRTI